ncbi:MAG: type II toxin-antitoxin system RelE/ParE family toxin [Nitrospira sp.]|nr:type II toxin-antitoxin system RelE/ParE family toxin [Nitrospira sp.]
MTHSLHPDLKHLIKSAIRTIAANPERGESLKRELHELQKYRVRRFRVVYGVHHKIRIIRLLAVGHRRSVDES